MLYLRTLKFALIVVRQVLDYVLHSLIVVAVVEGCIKPNSLAMSGLTEGPRELGKKQ